MISFKSQHINSVKIQRIHNNTITNQNAKVIELDINSNNDYEIIREIGLNWDNGKTFACDIFNQFTWQKYGLSTQNFPACKFFLLTKNMKTNSSAADALGVATIYQMNKDTFFIPHLQVQPNNKYKSINRKYKHIGECLVKSILEKYEKFNFKVYPLNANIEKFFEKLNFQKEYNSFSMILKR